uniref:PDZ domain-containing protein n=1 Tax=Anopheles culicifacies TaxID=139723 RepID=A0A182LRF7_9DIPT
MFGTHVGQLPTLNTPNPTYIPPNYGINRSPVHNQSSRIPTNQNGSAGSPRQQQQQQQQPHAQQQTQQPRPQTLTPTRESPANGSMAMQTLILTVNKDATGYGMKVSGDKPVFVESVKPGGAARRAGLMPDDMILKVKQCGSDKDMPSDVVELTVQRGSNRMQRPSPSTNSIAPMTPVAQRNSITAPQPVDVSNTVSATGLFE